MLCLADVLRVGTPDRAGRGAPLATQALEAFESLGLHYSVARAQHYVASAARAQDDLPAAAAAWEQALASAKTVGNTSLEGTVYINLGVTLHRARQRGRRRSTTIARATRRPSVRGDERRAAYSRANAGALLIEFGGPPDEGLRFVEAALRVVRGLEDRNFEVFCLQLIAAHDRFTGR